ncbi:peptidylprolyl isomerase [Flavobacteriaceae bacterium]|nr:peptidylprolyl isomerase [Flavobacteriaceae bacterium]
MRLLTFYLCLTVLSCTGPNSTTHKKGQLSQDSLKQNDNKEVLKNHNSNNESLSDSLKEQVNFELKTDEIAQNAEKLPVLTPDNVVELLTEFGKQHPQNKVRIKTRFGEISIELFDETPLHRANFLYLTQQDYFTETFFHRIVPNFIIQGGNSDLRSTPKKRKSIGPNYLLPAEINPHRIHTYGTISGAKEYKENPDKLSAPYEFFIFCGPDISGRHLNGNYTIFGQVTQGMDVVETIANLPADEGEWPKSNVYIEVSIDE